MKKSRFSEAQMVGILREVELGAKVAEACIAELLDEPARARRLSAEARCQVIEQCDLQGNCLPRQLAPLTA